MHALFINVGWRVARRSMHACMHALVVDPCMAECDSANKGAITEVWLPTMDTYCHLCDAFAGGCL